MFNVNTSVFFLPAAAIDHIPSTAVFSSAVYNGKESPKQQLVKNNLPALTRPSVLGICIDLLFNNPKPFHGYNRSIEQIIPLTEITIPFQVLSDHNTFCCFSFQVYMFLVYIHSVCYSSDS